MPTPTIRCALLTAVLAVGAFAAEDSAPTGLRGPVIGYVLDGPMQAIRPVNGIPGSSTLGPALALPFPVAAAAFSPRGDFALAVSGADDRNVYLLRNLGAASPTADVVDAALTGADRVLLNADASAAALLSSDARRLQLVRGLPGSPSAGPPLDLSSIPGTITALAVDRAATNILIAATDGGQGALYLAAADPQFRPRLIANFGSPTALALLHGDQDAVVADAAVNRLTLLRNFAGTPEAFLLAGERDGVAGPAGLQVSPDGRKLYIANGGSRTLDVWNFDGQSIEASFPLDAEPTRLAPLQAPSTFVLNEAGENPLLLLDAADNLAVYFVPAGRDR